MVPSGKLMLEEVLFQLELIMSKPVGDPAMSEVDRELTPILKQITTLSCGDIHHPAVSYVVNWLTQPQRTAEEFNYVLGPLSKYVYSTDGGGLDPDCYFTYRIYMYHMGTESLAVKCPILEGPWEHAAWLMVQIFKSCVYGQIHWSYTVQDSLTAWIISVIGDANLCPNPHLRREFMCLLKGTNINNHYGPNALEFVMLAMFDVDFNYLEETPYSVDLEMISFQDIVDIFQSFNKDDILKYSHTLCNKLENVKTSRLSSIIHDVTCQYGMNTSKYNEPYELNTITHLMKTVTGYVNVKLKEREGGDHEEIEFYSENRLGNILSIAHMFRIIMHNFQGCLLLPQLISFTSSLIMEVMEFICLTSRDLDEETQYGGQPYLEGIKNVNHDLGKICVQHGYGNILHSPLGREIWRKYSNRLKSLRTSLMNIFAFSNVQALIYFDILLKEV